MKKLTIELPLPPRELSSNFRGHWGKKFKATRGYRYNAWHAGCQAKYRGNWSGKNPVVLDIEYRHCRGVSGYCAKDVTNALHALKSAIDGLVDAGVMPDDTRKWMQLGSVHLHTTKEELDAMGKDPGVTITVTEET